jgi:hypothetical protein
MLTFEQPIVVALQLLIIVMVFVSTVVLFTLTIDGLHTQAHQIGNVADLSAIHRRNSNRRARFGSSGNVQGILPRPSCPA